MVSFNVPLFLGKEFEYMQQAVDHMKICGDGAFTMKCNEWMERKFHAQKIMLTTSGTTALEMALLLSGIGEGDEVILPSFTFSSTANAIVMTKAKLVFVDIRPDTMNMDENLIEVAITNKTRAIMVVHYAGVACEMDAIMKIADRYSLIVIEDAAQGVMSQYQGMALGTIGSFGCYSFHETKNYSMGEGGAIVINNQNYNERAEILREKGTNRSQFYRGEIDKYTWVGYGSSYLPSDLNAAYLYAQLEMADSINQNRLDTWNYYYEELKELENGGLIELPYIPEGCIHNAHLFYIKVVDIKERTRFISYMKEQRISCVFHYIPLHSAPARKKYGRFCGEDVYTTKESERLVRLPMYYDMRKEDRASVVKYIKSFFS